ncbi:hypothetical protein [Streptomyces himalayensis]|uniref:Large polyvalent protein associated domain-containing protein n=1 Tax=Streptomyces himalayensis subsp. himalayensis TaxID=2756131 RepID=A0A7W0DUF3_9ACTN|nr:hypothetical protein [Streptomyces himalayensis]MBA2951430.1 hypothetical protein [Streptomyces himalayensis subsp. himalayensis]
MGDGFGGFLSDIFGEGGALRDAGDWVDENVFGKEQGPTKYVTVNGERVPVRATPAEPNNVISRNIGKPVGHGLERALHGMAWLYDNGVSQPMSTFLLQGTHAENGNFGDLLKASAWGKAWDVAEHVSPGQAFWANHGEVEEILKGRPLYATPPKAYLPPGWDKLSEDEQQSILGEAGLPIVGNRAVEEIRRDVSFFTFASGATDLAARWWLDPTILGMKVAGGIRTAAVVKPRPKGGWSGEDISRLMASSTMAKTQEFLWANKDNPALINNLSMFKKSGLGPRAGGIISKLKSPEEVNLFLRTTLGDIEARAKLEAGNEVAAARLVQDSSRLAAINLEALPRVIAQNNPRALEMVTKQQDILRRRIAADEDLAARYDAMLKHYGELDAINLTRYSTGRAERRTAAQASYRTGPALGSLTARNREPAIVASRAYGSDFFGNSLTMVRSFKEAHPNGIIAVDDIHPEAVDELRGHLARIPGIGPDIRQEYLNKYLQTTTEGQRLAILDEIEGHGVKAVAERRGFTSDEAKALYREYRANITRGQEEMRRYSGVNFPDSKRLVDEFVGADGNLKVHPNLATKLANNHILIDLQALDRTLVRHGSALKALRTKDFIGNPDKLLDGLDFMSHLWKFTTLFRLGYIPRVLGDDLVGQMARVGAAAMVVRAGYGTKNLATNLFHWKAASRAEAREAVAREGMKYADGEIVALKPQADALRTEVAQREAVHRADYRKALDRARHARNKLNAMDPADTVKLAAMQQLVTKLEAQAKTVEKRLAGHSAGKKTKLAQLDDLLNDLNTQRTARLTDAEAAKAVRLKGFRQSSQLYKEIEAAPGVVLPPALAGEQGEYYMKLISADDSLRTLLQSNKQLIHSNLIKSYNHKDAAPISYPQNPSLYVESWNKAINHMIMQDELALKAAKGESADQMAHWLAHTPQGRAYRKRLGIQYDTNERIAQSVWHEVNEYMPPGSGLREAALKGEADIEYLTEMAKVGYGPSLVHTTNLGEALAGSNATSRSVDRVIDWWYKWAASIPADRMSRHPLFNQLYEGHARNLTSQELKQGAKVSQKDADRLAETARRLALKDTRKLVFDIAHRSDAASMLRFMSPFFAATTEAWQRWARIIADRPQTVGYASIFFNAPISWGWMQDLDGNKVQRDGTVMVWDEKAKKLVPKFVPKGERRIMTRVPKFIANGPIGKVWGMDSSGNWSISQDSMNMITQGDPWFNPGTGPIVSIPASLLVKDKPKDAEILRHMGVLPFGPTPGNLTDTFAQQALPQYAKNFLTAWDTSDERYQRIKLQIMQQAAYEHANLGKPMPSAQEIADRTKSYWLWSAVSAWTQPFATQKPDKYQFFRDQYNALRRKNPLSADEEYLKRFGESHFIFAQATTENVGGVPATQRAVELTKQYADLIAANPELAALIVGPEGNGPFSPEAYTYQLSTPLIPGGAEMQRTRMSADEAMKENQKRLGWTKYMQMMNRVTAELHKRGLNSFQDPGAEDLLDEKRSYTSLYSEPTYPDGSRNPYYNEEWSKDFFTFDVRKYDRMIPNLTAIARSDLAKQPSRTDLRKLQEYLGGRQALLQELLARDAAGGAKTLAAKSNADLAAQWGRFVDTLVEEDTRFGDLFHRYLSRDLGVDALEIAGMADEEEEEVA